MSNVVVLPLRLVFLSWYDTGKYDQVRVVATLHVFLSRIGVTLQAVDHCTMSFIYLSIAV